MQCKEGQKCVFPHDADLRAIAGPVAESARLERHAAGAEGSQLRPGLVLAELQDEAHDQALDFVPDHAVFFIAEAHRVRDFPAADFAADGFRQRLAGSPSGGTSRRP